MWTIVRTSKSCYHCSLRMFAFHFISSWIWVSLGYDLGYGCGYLGSGWVLQNQYHLLGDKTWYLSSYLSGRCLICNLSSNRADKWMLEVMADRKWRSTRHLAICKFCNVAFEYNTASWTTISCTSSLLSRNKSCDQELYKKRNFLSKFLPAIACRPPHPEKCQLIPTQEDVVDVAVHMCPLWSSPTKR